MRASPLAAGLVVLLLALLPLPAMGGDAPYPDLVERTTYTVWLTNGQQVECTECVLNGDRSVTVKKLGETQTRIIPADQIRSIENARTWSESLTMRGLLALRRNDWLEIERLLPKGIERGESAREATLALARRAHEQWPERTTIAKALVDLLLITGDRAGAKTVLREVLALDGLWEQGWLILVEQLKLDGDQAGIQAIIDDLRRKNPTKDWVLRLAGPMQEQAGDLAGAADSYRKLLEIHKDAAAGLAYARLLLRRGDHPRAAQIAEQVGSEPSLAGEAACIRGSALLHLAKDPAGIAAAQGVLAKGLASATASPVADWARYNLGLAAWRLGRGTEARAAWVGSDLPAARLGLAMSDLKPFAGDASGPLAAVASEYNACVSLMRGAPVAPDAFDANRPRHVFLRQVSDLLRNPANASVVDAIGVAATPEALRWQAYGHVLVKRWAQAEAILAKLPADDGYAAVYRVAIALGKGDKAAAAALLDGVAKARNPPPPAAYAARLEILLRPRQSEGFIEEFDGDPSEGVGGGWQWMGHPGIVAAPTGGRMVIGGQQPAAPDLASRLVRLVAADRLAGIAADIDLAGIAGGLGGIELVDEGRQAGAALAVLADGGLAWRELRSGAWGPWTTLPATIQGTQTTLRIDYASGRMTAVIPERGSYALGTGVPRQTSVLMAGIFGQADPGSRWTLAAERFRADVRR